MRRIVESLQIEEGCDEWRAVEQAFQKTVSIFPLLHVWRIENDELKEAFSL
jgi:hypothetical protein